jgi:DNA-binding transcriptional LysR family regulator
MDTRRLRHFLTVYQLGSIGHAAETLPITQPALSKSIRHLEAELECELFERTPTGVVPTIFGEALAHYARQIAGEIESARGRIAELRGGQTGEVRIGVGPSIAVNMMPMVTRRAQAERPGVRLEVREGLVDTIFPALRRGELDLVVGLWPRSLDRDFRVQTLLSDRIGVLAAAEHPLAKAKASLSDLCSYPWALPPRSQRWRMTLDEFFLSEGLEPPRAQVESNSAAYLKSLILSGDYLSYLPYQLVRSSDQAGRIVMLDADVPRLEPPVSVTYREGAIRSPATAYVVGVFSAIGQELASSA